MTKLIIIGLDGATFDLIKPWAAEGKLPTLARLMHDGVTGDLESTLPPVTSPAWPTFMTGKNPGKHGVFDFIRPAREPGTGSGEPGNITAPGSPLPAPASGPGSFTMVNASQIAARTLWEYLSDAGKHVIV